jgi:hypothetical protein
VGANDGSVLAFRQLMNNGSNSLRYNIVLVSDGYTQAEIPLFQAHCRGFLRKLFWTAPFSSLRCTFNVFALEVSSTASGVDDPLLCGDMSTGSGAMPATYFDATMCGGGRIRRAMTVDSGLVRNRVAGFLPQVHSILVLVNSTLHGGTQSDVAVFTTEPGWEDTALHEYGHVLGLADEYGCYVCDGTDSGRTYDWFDSLIRGYGLPDQPNVTPGGSRAGLKWGSMVASSTPVPTTPGSVPAGTVGMFESARYYDLGLYRPEEFCAMRTTGAPFCAVCRSAITTALAPWTPTTTCVTPTATPASVTLDARVHGKVMLSPGRGGYEATLDATTNLPASPAWTYRLDNGTWAALPATRKVRVPINLNPGTFVYNHAADVRARVTVADLDYWVPATPAFLTAQATDAIALRQPDNAACRLVADYGNTGNVSGTGSASINVGGIAAGNGWLYLGTQKRYTRLAMRLQLDDGYFGPDDNAAWGLQAVTWTPTPDQVAGLVAFYDVTFDANGLCWLTSDPTTVVDPGVGFGISAKGKDAIGQSFNVTGRLIPTNVEYRRSISTIQIARIPVWEWPMRLEVPENVLNVVVDGVAVTLTDEVLKIDDLEVELRDEREQ